MFLTLNVVAAGILAAVLVVRWILWAWRVDSDWLGKPEFAIQVGMVVIGYAISMTLLTRGEDAAVIPAALTMAFALIFSVFQFLDWLGAVRRREAENRLRIERFVDTHLVRPWASQ